MTIIYPNPAYTRMRLIGQAPQINACPRCRAARWVRSWAACRCRDACWASSRACCCWSWAFSASSCDCCRSRDACWDFSELDSAVSFFCFCSRSAWLAFAWLYLSSYSLLGLAGGLSLVAVSRGPLYPGPYALASRSNACRSVVSPGVAPMS